MMGEGDAPGVMPQAVSELFDAAAKDDEHDWRFGVTYVEIYNERVKDLLNPEAAELEVREDARKGTHIQGAVEVAVGTVQARRLLHPGWRLFGNRKSDGRERTHCTRSSRHSVARR